MHCDQCQESIRGTGCFVRGVCGKDELTARLQDTLVYAAEGIALCAEAFGGKIDRKYGQMISECLFVTVTNTNFDDEAIVAQIQKALAMRDEIKVMTGNTPAHDAATWSGSTREEFLGKAMACSIDSLSENPDLRSLKSLILYGIKGLAAYTDHAAVLGYHDDDIYAFYVKGLSALTKDLSSDELLGLVMETGATAVKAMALLDKANTETYGNPEITTVSTGVGSRPGILISGHDLRDMEDLLKQTEGTGVDVYTHCEMLPAHYYPAFKKYSHFVGNYGNSWWSQDREFESFNGPILMTTTASCRCANPTVAACSPPAWRAGPVSSTSRRVPKAARRTSPRSSGWPKPARLRQRSRTAKSSVASPTPRCWRWPTRWSMRSRPARSSASW